MLSHSGQANKRAGEIREELIGIVKAPAMEAVDKARNVLIAPIKDQLAAGSSLLETDPRQTWNNGVTKAYDAASGLLGSPKQ